MRNRMVKEKRLGIAILAIALAAVLLFTACAPRPIVKEKTAQFGWIMPLTGGGASVCQVIVLGGADYIRYFNEQEAIPGVRIELLWRDSALQVALFQSHYERLVEHGIPLIIFMEAPGPLALKERFVRDEVVAFSAVGHHEVTYPGFAWYYVITPTVPEQAAVLLEYFMENWEEERPPKVRLCADRYRVGV